MRRPARRLVKLVLIVPCIACDGSGRDRPAGGSVAAGDSVPVMLNRELPFRYPAPLYADRVQGNVTLRLVIDSAGQVVSESTRVSESSGIPGLDSAAISGSRDLRFRPAKAHGMPVQVSVLFPVLFRHPDAPPMPGDSSLPHRRE